MKMKKIIVLVLAAVMLLGALAGCAPKVESDFQYMQDKGTMIVGITEYEPMDYKNEDGEWIGFDADLANLVGEKLGVKVEFLVLADWGKKYYELESKGIDVIWNGMTITEEAKLNTNCTQPYAMNAQVVIMKADAVANYPDAASLKDLTFAVESGSAGEACVLDMGIEKPVALLNQAAALMEVEAGTADACVVDITLAKAMTGEGTSYEDLAIGVSLSSEEYGIGFRKGSDVTARVNEILDELKADGTLDALAETYNITLADSTN